MGGYEVTPQTTLDQLGRALLDRGASHKLRLAFGVWTLNFGAFSISMEQIDSSSLQTLSVGIGSK